MEKSFVENCWFIYGLKIKKFYIGFVVKHSTGEASGVEFDWKKIYDSKYLIGFFHTHPRDVMGYSITDDTTMKAWVSCMWRDLICGIWNETRTQAACYLFKKNKSQEFIRCYNSKVLFIGREDTGAVFKMSLIGC